MQFEYEEQKEIQEEELKIEQQISSKIQTQRISGQKFDLGANDDLITIKNTDDYNKYCEDNEELFSKRIMVSGCPSKDSEQPQKLYPRGSSLKTVGYGSVEKDIIIRQYQPELVIESKLGKDRLMSLYAINSLTQQNYQSHKFSSLEKLKTDELAYSNSNLNSKDQSAKMNIQDQRGSEPSKPEVLITEPEKQMPF